MSARPFTSIEFLKQILDLAKEVVEAEKETDQEEERGPSQRGVPSCSRKQRLRNTHIIVERIVTDIDDIVKKVRFRTGSKRRKASGWCKRAAPDPAQVQATHRPRAIRQGLWVHPQYY